MNQKMIKNGKKPISIKELARSAGFEDFDIVSDPFKLHSLISKELEDKKLGARFISMKALQTHFGSHPKGWRPYKPDCLDSIKGDLKLGIDPEGFVRRGDTILAVKPLEAVERHKTFLAIQANAMDPDTIRRQLADELRSNAREAGVDTVIKDGYYDEREKEDSDD